MEINKLQDLVIEACEILDASYSLKDDIFEIEVLLEEDKAQVVSAYLSTDPYDYEKINVIVEIGPIVKNTELLYTFLKNNMELDYGSYAIINDEEADILVLTDATPLDTCTGDELATIIMYMAEKADETEELLSKYK